MHPIKIERKFEIPETNKNNNNNNNRTDNEYFRKIASIRIESNNAIEKNEMKIIIQFRMKRRKLERKIPTIRTVAI